MKKLNEFTEDERKPEIAKFLKEIYLDFVNSMVKWSELTEQTIFFPKGYFGQTLVSLITGIVGNSTAARGDDLKDGSEVKTAARVHQLNNCLDCKARVAALKKVCPECGSKKIRVMRDSHWICAIKENNYEDYHHKTPTLYFLLVDDDDLTDNEIARFTVWTIIPSTNKKWQDNYVDAYYNGNYLARKKKGENPAPMNIHPKSPKFNSVSPVKIFEAVLDNKGNVNISFFNLNP